MASFDPAAKQSGIRSHVVQKYPIRRLEPSIQKFLKVLEIDLDRLHRHRLNIEKLIVQENWTDLNKEQINASRTIQQIKANIREVEKARGQTEDDDLETFDEKVVGMKEKAVRSIEAFTTDTIITNSDSSSSSSPTTPDSPSADITSTSLPSSFGQHQIQLHVVPHDSEAAASWENLQENLMELNEMIHDFATMVETQGEKVDRIEDNITTAQENVQQGAFSLGKAAKYKAAILPVAGAVLGGVVAGPLGLMAGAKIGGVIGAVGGGIAGYFSGNVMKKRQDKITDMDMTNLKEQHSASPPEDVQNEADNEVKAESSSRAEMMPWNWSSRKNNSDSGLREPTETVSE